MQVTTNTIDELFFEETQKAAYEEQCELEFAHPEQPSEDFYKCMNNYLVGIMMCE